MDGIDADRYSLLPSDQQAFISDFSITGYNTEKDAPNYQAGDFCITMEDHERVDNLEGWVVRDCDSGSQIAWYFPRRDEVLSKCLEDIDWFFFTEIRTRINVNFFCQIVTTEPEAPTTQEQETTKKPCEPCRDVLDGALAGYYELQSEDDPRCDDGCSYTNQQSQEFCFRPGGFETKLECQFP